MRHIIKAKVHTQGHSWLPVQGAQSATLALVDLLQIETSRRLDSRELVLPPSAASQALTASEADSAAVNASTTN